MRLAMRVAKVSAPTGRILAGLLVEKGAEIVPVESADTEGVVCYGVPYTGGLPSLNARAGTFNNIAQMNKLSASGIRVPPFVTNVEYADWTALEFPLLAREEKHHGGRDIRPVLQIEEVPWRMAAGAKFFTQYIPIAEEYRAWVYRRRVQAMYTKDMRYPDKFKRIGRNFHNGFAFSFLEKTARPVDACDLAAKAVFALDLDFGAVDLIKGKDGRFYVLEVNTAPGVTDGIRQGVSALASAIVKWARGGYKRQNTRFL